MADHVYRFLKVRPENPREVVLAETGKAVEKAFPNSALPSKNFVQACCAAARIHENDGSGPLFILARVLKGSIPVNRRDAPYTMLFPYAIVFTEVMDLWYECPVYAFNPQESVDLGDDDTLEILFEQAWTQAIFGMDFNGKGEDLLSVAIKYSTQLPETYFKGVSNSHKRRLLGIAEYLQNNNGGPFLLPQVRLAEDLELPQSTLNAILQALRKEGFLQVSTKAVHLQGKAQWYTFKSPNRSKSKS